MTDQNGWPDASKPGVPLNPERDGWHWVVAADPNVSTESAPWRWASGNQHWLPPVDVSGALPLNPSRVQWRYLGRCHTPAEVSALIEAARREEREACARVLYASATRLEESAGRRRLNQVDAYAAPILRGTADAIRALNPERSYGLAAAVEAARREEREACAEVADKYGTGKDGIRASRIIRDAIRARGDAIPGEYQSEAEQERDELFNRLLRADLEAGYRKAVKEGEP